MAGLFRSLRAAPEGRRPLPWGPPALALGAAKPRVWLSPWEPTVLGFSCLLLLLRSTEVVPGGFSEVRWEGPRQGQLIGLFLTLSARKAILGAAFSCSGFQGLQEGCGSPISRYSFRWPSSRSFC